MNFLGRPLVALPWILCLKSAPPLSQERLEGPFCSGLPRGVWSSTGGCRGAAPPARPNNQLRGHLHGCQLSTVKTAHSIFCLSYNCACYIICMTWALPKCGGDFLRLLLQCPALKFWRLIFLHAYLRHMKYRSVCNEGFDEETACSSGPCMEVGVAEQMPLASHLQKHPGHAVWLWFFSDASRTFCPDLSPAQRISNQAMFSSDEYLKMSGTSL